MRIDSPCDWTSENLPLGVSVIRVEVQPVPDRALPRRGTIQLRRAHSKPMNLF